MLLTLRLFVAPCARAQRLQNRGSTQLCDTQASHLRTPFSFFSAWFGHGLFIDLIPPVEKPSGRMLWGILCVVKDASDSAKPPLTVPMSSRPHRHDQLNSKPMCKVQSRCTRKAFADSSKFHHAQSQHKHANPFWPSLRLNSSSQTNLQDWLVAVLLRSFQVWCILTPSIFSLSQHEQASHFRAWRFLRTSLRALRDLDQGLSHSALRQLAIGESTAHSCSQA